MRMLNVLVKGVAVATALVSTAGVALAETAVIDHVGTASLGPIGAGLAIGIAALGGTMSQGKAVAAMLESSARNPSAAGKLTVPFFVGLALIESLVILAFVIAIGQK